MDKPLGFPNPAKFAVGEKQRKKETKKKKPVAAAPSN